MCLERGYNVRMADKDSVDGVRGGKIHSTFVHPPRPEQVGKLASKVNVALSCTCVGAENGLGRGCHTMRRCAIGSQLSEIGGPIGGKRTEKRPYLHPDVLPTSSFL